MSITAWGIVGLLVLAVVNAAIQHFNAQNHKPDEPKPVPVPDNDLSPNMSKDEFTKQVNAIADAAGAKAPPEFILKHLRAGSSVAEVMADRIKELENGPAEPVKA